LTSAHQNNPKRTNHIKFFFLKKFKFFENAGWTAFPNVPLKLSSHPINLWFGNYLTRLRISIEQQSQVEIGRVKIGHGNGYLRVKLGQDQSIQGLDKDWIRAFESWIKFGVFEDLGRIEFRLGSRLQRILPSVIFSNNVFFF